MKTHETTGFRTSVQMIAAHSLRTPNKVAIRQKKFGIWREITWANLHKIIGHLGAGMIEIGINPGKKIGILAENRQEWVITQFAIQSIGATVVGMYPTSPAVEIDHFIRASDTEFLFIEDQEQFDKIVEIREHAIKVKRLIAFDPKGLQNESFMGLLSFDQLLLLGRKHHAKHADELTKRQESINKGDTALIVFTSGSTGLPKAAEISHANLYAACALTIELFEELPKDTNILSYLPLCHIAEQNMTVVNSLASRHIMNFGESLRTITLDLRDVAPELFFGVPRIWEKMQSALMVQIKTASPFKRRLTEFAIRSGISGTKVSRNDWSLRQRLVNIFWDAVIYRHIRSYLGLGRVQIALTAAAPISEDILVFLRSIGINVREIWGMTETTGAASIQPPWGECSGRVGFFPENISAKIAQDGELLVKGPLVFKGYYKNKKATSETIVDGWLCTGDIATKCADGSFSILDRKKDIMINSAGKNLSPLLIENTMKASTYVKECIVIADQRPYVIALVQIDLDTVRLWAEQQGITFTTFRSLTEIPEVINLIDQEISKGNKKLARVEQIKKVWLLPKELDHDDGEVTATLKVRRSKIAQIYESEIEELYAIA